MKDFQIKKEARGPVQLIHLSGSVDMYSFPRLETQLTTLFGEGQYAVVLDCLSLDYIGSAGLSALIGFAKQAREQKGDIRLINVPDRIHKIIKLLGFTKELQIHDTEEAAIASFQTK